MKKDSAPQAEWIKQPRDGYFFSRRANERMKSGAWPIRWRGYYRALKRGESWATNLNKKQPVERLLLWVYREDTVRSLVYSENPFLLLF